MQAPDPRLSIPRLVDPLVLVLFGTQTGNSESLAADIAAVMEEEGFDVELVDMADAYPELLEEADCLAAVLCTWSDGTFPDNAVAFWDALLDVRPDCSRLDYGIVALGDRLYEPHYQVAAHNLAAQLDGLGATRLLDTFEIDGMVRPSHRHRVREWARRLAAAHHRAPSSRA